MKKPASLISSAIRLNKAIADSGYCARRKADQLIADGCVQVNGETVTIMGAKVNLQLDCITIHGKVLPISQPLYLLFHKPVGLVTSRQARSGQKTIYSLLPPECHTVDPAGRLDQDSSGALILSNDGDFLFQITHPSFHLPKRYEVVLQKPLSSTDINRLEAGIPLHPEDKLAKMKFLPLLEGNSSGSEEKTSLKQDYSYRLELLTGYKRQIRRMFAILGYRVSNLQRLSVGPIHLDDLPVGDCRELTSDELKALKEFKSKNDSN